MKADVEQVLASLGLVVLVRKSAFRFYVPKITPDWFDGLAAFSLKQEGCYEVVDECGFVGNFMVEAEEFWKAPNRDSASSASPRTIKSGVWNASGSTDTNLLLELTAIRGEQGPAILIKSLSATGSSSHLQEARNSLLGKEKLEDYLEGLEEEFSDIKGLFEGFPDLIFRSNLLGEVTRVSSRNEAQLSAKQLEDLFPERLCDRIRQMFLQVVQESGISKLEFVQEANEGLSSLPQVVEIRCQPLSADSILVIARDISEQKKLEEELRFAKISAEKASSFKSNFLANMSHEIRTPMNGVLGMLSLLEDTKLNDEQNAYVELIKRSSNSLLSIVNDILDLSQVEAGKLRVHKKTFNVFEEVRDIAFLLEVKAREAGLDFDVKFDQKMPQELFTDINRFRQVIINLVGNAIKFTEEGWVLLEFAITENKQNLKVSVHDTGIGIPKDKQELIFSAFEQADESHTVKGTGLGLLISKKLVELLGGSIELESEVGEGTEISFEIPLEGSIESQSEAANGRLACKLAVLEETQLGKLIISELLGYWGAEFSVASNLDELMNIIVDSGDELDFILVNSTSIGDSVLTFPEMVRSVNSRFAGKIVLCKSFFDPRSAHEIDRVGYHGIVEKPLIPQSVFVFLRYLQNPDSAFTSDFDLLLSSKESPDRGVVGGEQDLSQYKILLVEDNLINRKVALGALKKTNANCDVAKNGLEALRMLDSLAYDLILMDCYMPELDGFEATKIIRNRDDAKRDTKIIAMTASAMSEDRDRCLAAGMNSYISKPFDLKDLYLEIVKTIYS